MSDAIERCGEVLGFSHGAAGELVARLSSGFAFGQTGLPARCRPDFQSGEHP